MAPDEKAPSEGRPPEKSSGGEVKGSPKPIELVDNSGGDRIDLGHPAPRGHGPPDASQLEEAGHPTPKMEAAPVKAPKEAVPPPSKPSGASESTPAAKPSGPAPPSSDE